MYALYCMYVFYVHKFALNIFSKVQKDDIWSFIFIEV